MHEDEDRFLAPPGGMKISKEQQRELFLISQEIEPDLAIPVVSSKLGTHNTPGSCKIGVDIPLTIIHYDPNGVDLGKLPLYKFLPLQTGPNMGKAVPNIKFLEGVPEEIEQIIVKKEKPVVQEPEQHVMVVTQYRDLSELEKQRNAPSWDVKTDGETLIKEILDGGRINQTWINNAYKIEETSRAELNKEYQLAEQLFENSYLLDNIGEYGTMMLLDYTSTLPETEEATGFAKELLDTVPDITELLGYSNAVDVTEGLCSLYNKNPNFAINALDNAVLIILSYGPGRGDMEQGHEDFLEFIDNLHEL